MIVGVIAYMLDGSEEPLHIYVGFISGAAFGGLYASYLLFAMAP